MTNHTEKSEVAQAQIVDALARIHEAMLVQGEQEVTHALATEPCAESNAKGDAAVRAALLSSEDAMIVALSSLPVVAEGQGPLLN